MKQKILKQVFETKYSKTLSPTSRTMRRHIAYLYLSDNHTKVPDCDVSELTNIPTEKSSY